MFPSAALKTEINSYVVAGISCLKFTQLLEKLVIKAMMKIMVKIHGIPQEGFTKNLESLMNTGQNTFNR